MAAIGIVMLWAGYSLLYYGLDQLHSGNDGLLDLVWPGRFDPSTRPPPDAPGAGGSNSSSGQTPPSGVPNPAAPPSTPGTSPGSPGAPGTGPNLMPPGGSPNGLNPNPALS